MTLKGPVLPDVEKNSVEQKAVGVAGAQNVVNEMDIAPANQ